MAAPFFIDWNDYRDRLEAFGREVTGREVKIAGNVRARLFPQPTVWLEDIRIADPQDAEQNLLNVANLRVRMRLAPLIQGEIKLETIHLSEPVIALQRHTSGTGSWKLTPRLDLERYISDGKVAFENITIENGRLIFIDNQRSSRFEVDTVDATLSARSLNGPWRFRGTGMVADELMSIRAATGQVMDESPVKLSLRLSPEEPGGLSYQFEGEQRDDKIHGEIRITQRPDPAEEDELSEPATGLEFTSNLRADFQRIVLQEMELTPTGDSAGGNLLGGNAQIHLGRSIKLSTQITAAEIDADHIFASNERRLDTPPDLLRLLKGFSAELPATFLADINLESTSLIFRGQSVDRFKLRAELARDRITVAELSGSMPGQTQGSFRGAFLPGAQTEQVIGSIQLSSLSLKDFALWLWPHNAAAINEVWTGTRGRFALDGDIDLSRERSRLHNARFDLEGDNGLLDVISRHDNSAGLSIDLQAGKLDIGRFAPAGLTPAGIRGGITRDLFALVETGMSQGNVEVNLQSDQIVIGKADIKAVDIDLAASKEKVNIRSFEIGDLAGAKVQAQGELAFVDQGLTGTARASVKAPSTVPFLDALGLDRQELVRPLSGTLSPLDVQLEIASQGDPGSFDSIVSLSGKAGSIRSDARLTFSGDPANWRQAKIETDVKVESAEPSVLFSRLGIDINKGDSQQAMLNARLKGSAATGLASSLRFETLGADAQFAGVITWPENSWPQGDGRLALLSEKAWEFYRALGVVTKPQPEGTSVFAAEGALKFNDGRWHFNEFQGTAGGVSFTGSLTGNNRLSPARLDGKIRTGALSLGWLLGAASLRNDTPPLTMDTRFDGTKFAGINGSLIINTDALEISPQLVLNNAQIRLDKRDNNTNIDLTGKSEQDGKFDLSVAARPSLLGLKTAVRLDATAPLSDILRPVDSDEVLRGQVTLSAQLSGDGRSPTGLLSSMAGSGRYDFIDMVIPRLNPQRFASLLSRIKEPDEIDGLIIRSLRTGEFNLGSFNGDIAVESGVATFEQRVIRQDDVETRMRIFADLPAGKVDIGSSFKVLPFDRLPAFEVAFTGRPAALERVEDTQGVKSYLTVNVLSKGIDQLEELQREQERLLAEQREQEQLARERAQQRRKQREAELARIQAAQEVEAKQRLQARFLAEWEARQKAAEKARLEAEEQAQLEREAERRALAEERRRQRQAEQRAAAERARLEALAARQRAEQLRLQALQPSTGLNDQPATIIPRQKPVQPQQVQPQPVQPQPVQPQPVQPSPSPQPVQPPASAQPRSPFSFFNLTRPATTTRKRLPDGGDRR